MQGDTRNWLVAHLCGLLVELLMVVGLQSVVSYILKIYILSTNECLIVSRGKTEIAQHDPTEKSSKLGVCFM